MVICVAEVGLSLTDFWDLTIGQTFSIIHHYRENRKTDVALQYNTARAIAYYSILPSLEKKDRDSVRKTAENLLKYPFEVEEGLDNQKKIGKIITGEAAKRLSAKFKTLN